MKSASVGLVLGAVVLSTPALALNTRSFVSPTGNDGNPCTLAAPCRTFATAIAQTNAGGEVSVLGTAGYGPFTITKAISIVNPGAFQAGVATLAGQTGIQITAGVNDRISLRGLTLEGGGAGVNGIAFMGGKSLTISDTNVRGFKQNGILIGLTNAGATVTVTVTATSSSENGADGILVRPGDRTAVNALFNHVETNNNVGAGISMLGDLQPNGSSSRGTVVDSVSAHNTIGYATRNYMDQNVGVPGYRMAFYIFRSRVFGNTIGVSADGSAGTAATGTTISQSNLEGNKTIWTGGPWSYGDNYTGDVTAAAGGGITINRN